MLELSGTSRSLSSARMYGLLAIALLLTSLPIFVSVHPPFGDYLNHLARIAVLRDLEHLGRYFSPNPAFVPNLGFDYLMLALSGIFPLSIAGKLAVFLTIAAFGGGFAALYGAVHRVRSPWALSGFLLVFTYPLMIGLINYVLGLGLLMLLLAGDLTLRGDERSSGHPRGKSGQRVALAILGGGALAVTHLMSFLLLFVFTFLIEVLLDEAPMRRRIARTLPFLLGLLVPLLLVLILSPTRDEAGSIVPSTLVLKMVAIQLFPVTGHVRVDQLFLFAALVAVLVLAGMRRLRLDFRIVVVAAIAGLIWLITPYGFKTTLNVDMRLPILIALMLFLAFAPGREKPFGAGVWATVMGLIAFRGLFLAVMFYRETPEYRKVDEALAALPKDALVICVRHKRSTAWDEAFWKPTMVYAAHQGIPHGLFVSGTFDLPTQQSILLKPEWKPIDRSFEESSENGGFTASLAEIRAGLAQVKAPHGPVVLYVMPAREERVLPDLPVIAKGENWALLKWK